MPRPLNAEELKYVTALKNEQMALYNLIQSEGWKLFKERACNESGPIQAMTNSTTDHELTKHFGAFHAMRSLRTWPERQLEALAAAIEQVMAVTRK